MSRYRAPSTVQYSFGPGGMTPAVRAILLLCGAGFVLTAFLPQARDWLGVVPQDVVTRGRVWQPATYIFIHAGLFHALFNMLGIWMFGVEVERMWGTRRFARFFMICGITAGVATVAAGLLPIDAEWRLRTYYAATVGASGAFYGVAYAWGRLFPYRSVLLFLIFPVQAQWFAYILIAIDLAVAISSPGSSGVAHIAHLAGLAAAILILNNKRGPGGPIAELRYRYLRWKMNRLRKRFDVVEGGRDRGPWVH
jgi:membrane associated rhomboid family serine protease